MRSSPQLRRSDPAVSDLVDHRHPDSTAVKNQHLVAALYVLKRDLDNFSTQSLAQEKIDPKTLQVLVNPPIVSEDRVDAHLPSVIKIADPSHLEARFKNELIGKMLGVKKEVVLVQNQIKTGIVEGETGKSTCHVTTLGTSGRIIGKQAAER